MTTVSKLVFFVWNFSITNRTFSCLIFLTACLLNSYLENFLKFTKLNKTSYCMYMIDRNSRRWKATSLSISFLNLRCMTWLYERSARNAGNLIEFNLCHSAFCRCRCFVYGRVTVRRMRDIPRIRKEPTTERHCRMIYAHSPSNTPIINVVLMTSLRGEQAKLLRTVTVTRRLPFVTKLLKRHFFS